MGRNLQKANQAKQDVVSVLPPEQHSLYSMNIIPMECDHCSLTSVRNFRIDLKRQLDESWHPSKWKFNGIDVLCLNAAVLQPRGSKAEFTEDGFEVTFQTNHLAPFLLANLTVDLLNPFGRVVFSSSGLHLFQKLNFDGMIDAETNQTRESFEMMNGKPFDYKQSYAMSKLCVVGVCLELNQRLQSRAAIATCFSPGLITTSGLFRRQPKSCEPIYAAHNKDALRREKTIQWGAGSLVYMAIADASGKEGALYWRDAESFAGPAADYGKEFCPMPISYEHLSQEQCHTLWELSCKLTGITSDR